MVSCVNIHYTSSSSGTLSGSSSPRTVPVCKAQPTHHKPICPSLAREGPKVSPRGTNLSTLQKVSFTHSSWPLFWVDVATKRRGIKHEYVLHHKELNRSYLICLIYGTMGQIWLKSQTCPQAEHGHFLNHLLNDPWPDISRLLHIYILTYWQIHRGGVVGGTSIS